MSIRTSKVLLRLVLTLISIQFLAPSFLWCGETEKISSASVDNTIHSSVKKVTALSIFLERIEEEREDEVHWLPDFVAFNFEFLSLLQPNSSASDFNYFSRTNHFDLHPPLFVLHCTYII